MGRRRTQPKLDGLVLDMDLSMPLPTVYRGRVGDQSIKDNHGGVYGRPAGFFLGSGDSAELAISTMVQLGLGDFQIHARVKLDSSQTTVVTNICSIGSGGPGSWLFAFYEGDFAFFSDAFSIVTSDKAYFDDAYHTFSAIRDGSDMILIVDGAVEASSDAANVDMDRATAFQVGNNGLYTLDGHIAKLFIGKKTMTLAEGLAEAIAVHDGYRTVNPTAEWLFTDGTGNVTDTSGNNLTLVAIGMAWDLGANGGDLNLTAAGRVFDGTHDLIEIADAANLRFGTGPFQIHVLAKASSSQVAPYPQLVSKGKYGVGEWTFDFVSVSGEIEFYGDDGDINAMSSGTDYRDDTWHLFSAIRNGNDVSVLVDGIEVATDATAGDDLPTDAVLQIGCVISDTDSYFAGTIKHVWIARADKTIPQATLDAIALYGRTRPL